MMRDSATGADNRIIVLEGGDVTIFPSAAAASTYLEADDIEAHLAVTADVHVAELTAAAHGGVTVTVTREVVSDAEHIAVADRLLQFGRAVGIEVEFDVDAGRFRDLVDALEPMARNPPQRRSAVRWFENAGFGAPVDRSGSCASHFGQ